jgi:DNA-binding LacI/PurR family transcriptional regulator
MSMSRKRSTLSDVARIAGVSLTTASMGLADNPRVAVATKQKVRNAAERLRYVPHSAGRALRMQRVGAIAVVVPHGTHHVFSHPVLMSLLEGIISVANQHDLMTILSTALSDEDEESAYHHITRGRRADGVIVAAAAAADTHPIQLARSGYPITVIGKTRLMSDVSTVGIDDQGGAYRATRHLIEAHGAKRIAHISGPLGHQSAIDKREGYMAALAEAGLAVDPRLQYEGDYGESSGVEAARAFLPVIASFDALFSSNDHMALGALQVFRAAGIEVPRDLLMVGYDDHPLVRYIRPSLTTVRADMVQVGVIAAQTLIAKLNNPSASATHKTLPTELVLRASCGCTTEPS